MTPDPAPVPAKVVLTALSAQWRADAEQRRRPTKRKGVTVFGLYGLALIRCADALDAAIKEKDAKEVEQAEAGRASSAGRAAADEAISRERAAGIGRDLRPSLARQSSSGVAARTAEKALTAAPPEPPLSPTVLDVEVDIPGHPGPAGVLYE